MIRILRKAALLLFCTLGVNWFPASAQQFPAPCPGGPGPGQKVVGMTTATTGMASVHLCISDGSASSGQPAGPSAPPVTVNRYVAVAWHPDAADVWASWNRQTERLATEGALSFCSQAMGAGCTLAFSAWNSTIAIGQTANGELALGWGANAEAARAQAMQNCMPKGDRCKIKHQFTTSVGSDVKSYAPGKSVERTFYAFLAWPKTRPASQWLNKVWIVSGQPGMNRSERILLDQCKQESGAECTLAQAAMGNGKTRTGGVIASYFHPAKGTLWIATQSKQKAEARVRELCSADGVACNNVRIFDPFTPRLGNLDSPVGT